MTKTPDKGRELSDERLSPGLGLDLFTLSMREHSDNSKISMDNNSTSTNHIISRLKSQKKKRVLDDEINTHY